MHYMEVPPPEHLRHIVRCFWFLRARGGGGVQPVVPDGRVEIVLHLAEPFRALSTDGLARQAEALISGQLTRPVYLAPSAEADVVGIRFRTAAAGSALGIPLHTLRDHLVQLDDVVRAGSAALLRAAAGAEAPGQRAALISEALTRMLHHRVDPLAQAAVRSLDLGAGVEQLASWSGVSPRTLERRIQSAVGYAPRTLRQVLRFRRAFSALEAGSPPARVACDAGYHDQAHLTREFHRFAGAPPAMFFQRDPALATALMSDSYKT